MNNEIEPGSLERLMLNALVSFKPNDLSDDKTSESSYQTTQNFSFNTSLFNLSYFMPLHQDLVDKLANNKQSVRKSPLIIEDSDEKFELSDNDEEEEIFQFDEELAIYNQDDTPLVESTKTVLLMHNQLQNQNSLLRFKPIINNTSSVSPVKDENKINNKSNSITPPLPAGSLPKDDFSFDLVFGEPPRKWTIQEQIKEKIWEKSWSRAQWQGFNTQNESKAIKGNSSSRTIPIPHVKCAF